MFALDLFNNDHERRLAEGAVDQLEQRRIDDLAMKMDSLVSRAKTATTPEHKAALMKEFQKAKAERDSYFKIKDECMGYGTLVGEAGLPDVADKAAKMAQLNQPNKAGTDLATAQQRVNPNPNKGVVGHAVDWLRGKGGPGREGPTYESELDEAYGAVGSKALMNGNFAEFLKRRASHEPYDMDFGSEKIRITPAIMGAIAKKYMDDKNASDASPKNRDLKQNAVNNYRAFGYPNLMKQLIDSVATPGDTPAPGEPGEQLPLIEKAQSFQKKKSDEPPLTGRDVKNTRLSRELTKARAAYPTARSDIEALVMRDLDHADQVDAELKTKQNTDANQDQALQQAQAVNQGQAKNIQALQSRLSAVQQQLQIPTAKAVAPTQSTAKPTAEPVKQPGAAVRMPEPIYTEPGVAQDQDLRDKVKQLDDLAKAATMAALQRPDDKDMQAKLKQQIDNLQKQIEKLNKKSAVKKKKKMTYKKVQKPITGKEAPALPDPNVIDVDAFEIPTMDIPSQDDLIGAVPNDDTAQNDRPRELQKAAEGVEKPTGIGQMAKNVGQGQSTQNDPRYRKQVYQNQQDQARRQRTIARGKAGYGEEPDDFGDIPDMTEGAMSELDIERQDLERMTDQQFQRAYGISKEFWKYKNQALLKKPRRRPMSAQLARSPVGQKMTAMYGSTCPGCGRSTSPDRCICESTQRLHAGDPIIVTAPNEFEGATGEIYELSPSGKFVIVNLYNHGRHSMHLSDVEYNQYADDQDEEDDWYDDADEFGKPGSEFFPEGYQDFNKVEPYAVCLAGKPVKKFDYYEDARRFHDNWKQKLYREGDKAKADKITLMPLNLDEVVDAPPPQNVSPPAIISPAPAAKYMVKKPQAPQAQADEPAPRHAKGSIYSDDDSTLKVYKPEQYREAANPAQQAAIAIAKKKEQGVAEGVPVISSGVDPKIQFLQPTIQFAEKMGYKATLNPQGRVVAKLVNKQLGHIVHIGLMQPSGKGFEVSMADNLDWQTNAWSAKELAQDFKEWHVRAVKDQDFNNGYNEKPQLEQQGVAESTGKQLSVQQLATISDAALDSAYGYGRSQPGNTFGWQANLKSAAFAKQMIDKGITDVESISDAIHKGWNVTAQAFVKNPMMFDDSKTMAPEKLQAKVAQRQKLMTQQYAQLPEDEKEKDRVVARAMLQAITGGQQGVAEADPNAPYTPSPAKPFRNPPGFNKQGTGVGNKLADLNRAELANIQPSKGTPVPAKAFARGVLKDLKKVNVKEAEGSWIAYDPETKQIKKRFKTHTAGKSYAQTHGLGFASSEYYFDRVKEPVNELDVNTLKSYADKRGAQVAAMKADNPNPQTGSKEWVQQAVPAQQVGLANRKIARKERQQGVAEGYTPDTNYSYTIVGNGDESKAYDSKEEAQDAMRKLGAGYKIKRKPRTSARSVKKHFSNRNIDEESSTSSEAVEIALIRRVLVAHTDLIMNFGLDKVTQAIEEVAYNVGDVDEIGTSDVSGWIHQVKQILGAE